MSDRIDHLVQSHEQLRAAVERQSIEFAKLTAALGERCPANERRIAELEKRQRNGGRGSGWSDPRFWTTAIIAVGALIAAIKALAGG